MDAGDRLLRQVAELCTQRLGDHGICGRLNADQFACLLEHREDYADEMFTQSDSRINSGFGDLNVIIKYGIYTVEDREVSVEQMCDRALLAANNIKGKYGKHFALYDDKLRGALLRRQAITDGMETALATGQFEVYLQPKYQIRDGRLTGAEALVRWNHPKWGLQPPAEFIPIFERNGFITKLDQYVWERVCSLMQEWDKSGYPSINISVNVSRIDIYNTNLVDFLTGLMQRYGLSPSRLHLEITESAYTDTSRQLIETMGALRRQGFMIEMDDFGSGYSSLNSLKDMPIDLVKLDLKFLLGDDEYQRGGNILASVVRMTKWLSLPAIAEGVETAAQADFLKSIGCNLVQGYLYARPMPVGDFEALLDASSLDTEQLVKKSENIIDVNEFWRADSQSSFVFNALLGPALVFEYNDGSIDMLRANDEFFSLLGLDSDHAPFHKLSLIDQICADDRERFISMIEAMSEGGEERAACICWRNGGGEELRRVKVRARMLAESDGRKIIFASLEDITDFC